MRDRDRTAVRARRADRTPDAPDAALAAASLTALLARQTLAVERHRAALGRQLGLNDTEMSALVCLQQAGELTPGDLKDRLSLSSGGTTALIQRLVRAGHLERRPNPVDRRSVVVTATDETLTLLSALSAPLLGALDEAAAEFSPDERSTIGIWLDRIVKATEEEALDVAGRGDEDDDAPGRLHVPNSWF